MDEPAWPVGKELETSRTHDHAEALDLIDRAIGLMEVTDEQGGRAEDLDALKARYLMMVNLVRRTDQALREGEE